MASLTSARTLVPSDFINFLDGGRVCDLLIDEGEDAVVIDDIDSNERALDFADDAWGQVLMACQRGDVYSHRELVDYANDSIRGKPLRKLVAYIFWTSCLGRRGYTESEPQAADPKIKQSEGMLESLQSGHRIFVLENVAITDSDGVATGENYTNVKGVPTALQVGKLGNNCYDPSDRFWGCTTPRCSGDPISTYRPRGECC